MGQIKNILIALFSTASLVINASTADSLFIAANTAYNQAEYTQAISLYKSILLEEKQSSNLFFNLGNSYYQEGAIAYSILNYERALLLNPQDEKTLQNLAIAKQRTEQIAPIPSLFFEKWWQQFCSFLNFEGWSILFLLCVWLSSILAILFLRNKRKSHFQLLLLSLAFLLLIFMSRQKSSTENKKRFAIVLINQTLKQSASDNAPNSLSLPLGNKVQLINVENDWAFISLSNGDKGWLHMKSLIEI